MKHFSIGLSKFKTAYIHHNSPVLSVNNDSCNNDIQIEISGKNKRIYAYLQTVDDDFGLKTEEIGLNDVAFNALGLAEGEDVNIIIKHPTAGLEALSKKLSGDILNSAEYEKILDDIEQDHLSLAQISAFVTACHNFMTNSELAAITGAMINKNVMSWGESKKNASFCSLGGIGTAKAGIIASFIVAGSGINVIKPCLPYESLGSIGDCGFSLLTETSLKENQMEKMLKNNNIVIFNFNNFQKNSAASILLAACREIGIVPNNLLIASTIAMGVSFGVSHILFEIPVGKTAMVKTFNEAVRLRSSIEQISNLAGRVAEVVFTDGSEPLAAGLGSVAEIDDIIKILRNDDDASDDLRERALFLAGRLLDLTTDCGAKGYELAEQILTQGKALECFEKASSAQGAKKQSSKGEFHRDVLASYDGIIREIDNQILEQIVKYAGATNKSGAAILLNKKVGDEVKNGDLLYTLYCTNASDYDVACALVDRNNGYIISAE